MSSSSGRGWLEGTLDVISGMAPRPSTPVRSVQRPSSAPNSPLLNKSAQAIARLPSQDSLDRSIHNDSGHGKSTAQMIRDLRQSNARLTARTASMEADFMNQLNETTRTFEDKQRQLEESLAQKEKHIVTLEIRCKNAEARIREKDEQLSKLKEDSAFQRHTISDLRTQLHQLKQASGYIGEDTTMTTSADGLAREMEALKQAANAHKQENLLLQQEVARLESQLTKVKQRRRSPEDDDDDSEHKVSEHEGEHKEAIDALKKQLEESTVQFQEKEDALQSKIEELEQSNDSGDMLSQMKERDALIATLRGQIMEYSSQLTDLTSQIKKIKAEAEIQEQYRRDEADDLRVLNDAQEEEIDALRKQLQEALEEVEVRDQELEEKERELAEKPASGDGDEQGQSNNVLGELQDRMALDRLQKELETTKTGHENQVKNIQETLEKKLEDTKTDHEIYVKNLQDTIDELLTERDSLLSQLGSISTEVEGGNGEIRSIPPTSPSVFKELEKKYSRVEKQLKETQESLAAIENEKKELVQKHRKDLSALQEQKQMIESEYQAELVSKETELVKLRESAPGEATSERVNSLLFEIESLKKELSDRDMPTQSGGSLEEDLRKRLQSSKKAEKSLAEQLGAVSEEKDTELLELREKLHDRDTTISALVKSSVALEQQIASAKSEIGALQSKLAMQGGAGAVGALFACGAQHDFSEVSASLAHYKEAEDRLSQEVFKLKKQLEQAQKENIEVRRQLEEKSGRMQREIHEEESVSGSAISLHSSPQKQLQERDDAISRLVKQSMAQEQTIKDLRQNVTTLTRELETLRSSRTQNGAGPSWEDVEQLRQETEMFAGQVIEQDEEIEGLTATLRIRDDQVKALEKELELLRARSSGDTEDHVRVRDLEAEIDELKEANKSQRDELRELRQASRQFGSSADAVAGARKEAYDAKQDSKRLQRMVDDLELEIKSLIRQLDEERSKNAQYENRAKDRDLKNQAIESLEAELKGKEKLIEELKVFQTAASASRIDEMEIETVKEERDQLRSSLNSQSAAVDEAQKTIRELEQMLAEKSYAEANAYEDEKDELLAEIESLSRDLEEARKRLKEWEEEREIVNDFKGKLEEADDAREESERTIVETYERKLSLLKLDKDVTIDKLRKELTEEKEASAEELEEMGTKLTQSESEMAELREELSAQLKQREARIFALEKTLEAQEQLVRNMKSEMDHLQGSMENTAAGRREEIEDMQQELVDLTSTAARQDRELTALRMQLEESKLAHKAEVERLQDTISSLESNDENNSDHRTAADLQMELRMREVKDRLEKLKWRNTSLQEENQNLRDRLEKVELQRRGVDADGKTYELQMKLNAQSKRVKDLETELARAKAPSPPAKKAPVVTTPSPPEVTRSKKPSTPRRIGFLSRRRSNYTDVPSEDFK